MIKVKTHILEEKDIDDTIQKPAKDWIPQVKLEC